MAEVNESALSVDFAWEEPLGKVTAASLSRGSLRLFANGNLFWGSAEFKWTWVELLEWLASNWLAISVDDGLPFAAEPTSSWDLTPAKVVSNSSGSLAEDYEMALWEFRETHDFARALPGTLPPSLIVWREGLGGHILTQDSHHRFRRWILVEQFLVSIGEEIAAKIEAGTDARSVRAVKSWRSRNSSVEADIVKQVTGLTSREAPAVLANWRFQHNGRSLADAVARSEVLAAARMASELPSETVAAVLAEIASARRGSHTAVDELMERVLVDSEEVAVLVPYAQGHWVAQRTRSVLGLSPHERLDPGALLNRLGVEYREVSLGVEGIDAVAAWGEEYGPVVVINRDGRHSNSEVGRNASIAHEIAHLILDRHEALPAAEVLGGRANPRVERRARAFAAELLIPRSTAREAFDVSQDRGDIMIAVRELSRRYGVSLEIAAWQARNADRPLNPVARKTLATLVSAPWQF
ncbi:MULTISPECIES: ImmA/IrrE family metallo-endopeptidase [unclassified Frigoribacterium]|uniref:ImmA/IrrE family metallo-endopeptidase n=1 Tax=unclassified Frigoribacterium TaxID=2627005 RepID=UPI0009E8D60F|nr:MULTISPECIES: ImmA/IrrE family metallo-endopeptidase [unclassified Frigoribacterium]